MTYESDERLDAYLWDPAAPPDETVAEVERRVAPLRFDPRVCPLPSLKSVAAVEPRRRRVWIPLLASAAAILIIASAAAWSWRLNWPDGRPWPVVTADGSTGELAVGSTLRTHASEAATVRIARIGTLQIAGDSAVTLQSTTSNRHRLVLEEGSVRVRVWAPPFSVGIRTPAGDVLDLGCEFELTADADVSKVRVTSGWVQLDNLYGESLVPAGASSVMPRGDRPGAAVFDDATQAFREAVREYETAPMELRRVERVAALARPRDVLTLLQLVDRRRPAAERLIARAAELFPPPDRSDLERVRSGDRGALFRWVLSLPLPSPKSGWVWNWRDGLPFLEPAGAR